MADKIISETNKLVREEVKKAAADKVKLIGLYHHYSMIMASEKNYDHEANKRDYHYFMKQKALFNSALEIYRGSLGFNRDAIKNIGDFFTPEELQDPNFDTVTSAPAQNVWYNIFQKVEVISTNITPEDAEILKHLEHVDIIKTEDTMSFKVEFTFGKNEHIMNDKLTVEVVVNEDEHEQDGEGERYSEIKSTELKWYPGKDIRFHEVTVKAKNKKGKKAPPKTKLEKKSSFFWVFKDHKKPEMEEEEEEEDDEDQMDECSDTNLFYIASDMLSCFERDLYELSIPALFGIEVDIFKMDAGFGAEHEGENPTAVKADGAKPECKQQ